jgi:deazaflavin-dependent oxidoreductase (nitroreductase family)
MTASNVKMPGTPPGWVNRTMSVLLRTPGLRRLIGKQFALITVTGARTGRTYTTPVQYLEVDGSYVVTSQVHRRWWRNIDDEPEVRLVVSGEELVGRGRVLSDEAAHELLTTCLTRQPRLAKFYGVAIDEDGPDPVGVADLAELIVLIVIDPQASAVAPSESRTTSSR